MPDQANNVSSADHCFGVLQHSSECNGVQTCVQKPEAGEETSESCNVTRNSEIPEENRGIPYNLGMGATGLIVKYDDHTVLKKDYRWVWGDKVYGSDGTEYPNNYNDGVNPFDRELEIFQKLTPHPAIIGFYGAVILDKDDKCNVDTNFGIRLEYAEQHALRLLIMNKEPPPMAQRLKWSHDIASAVKHIHAHDVIHRNLSCRNVFVTAADEVKLGDFGCSTLPGQEPLGGVGGAYQLPCRGRDWDALPAVAEEFFALGSCIYEITAWQRPLHDVETNLRGMAIDAGKFPDTTGLPTAEIIRKCWWEEYESAAQVEEDLARVIRDYSMLTWWNTWKGYWSNIMMTFPIVHQIHILRRPFEPPQRRPTEPAPHRSLPQDIRTPRPVYMFNASD